uniref:Intersectin 2a n=1 Tax=Salarias fasciatus TaxID=181472 RepID=A0A672HIP4_SALFA
MSHLLRPGGASVWAITPEERGKHDKQFDTLTPVLGYVSGEQARKFFLQSGLPASVLAEIWNLADMDSDGKMDRLEFSIAMKLIKLTLQGRNLPPSLPVIMKQPPASNCGSNIPTSARFGMGSMPNLSVGVSSMSTLSAMPILTPIPANPPMPSLQPLMPTALTLPLVSGLHNGSVSLLASPLPWLQYSRTRKRSYHCDISLQVLSWCIDMPFFPLSLSFCFKYSSNSSSTTSLASNSPKMSLSDWAVPQASRLKYRQQFNTLDKLMSGYLSGPQVRNALMASNLTQTQLATIWTLADVDKDGQLRADEFILAMHLVDMAKTGRPLPLTLPQDLDKLKENFARGSAELEKRRLALEEEQRKERARREREEREAQERREREAREQENRRRLEEERRLERQREMERQLEEERMRELERKEAAKLELERQRREEWERGRKEELLRRREGEQEEISRLRARKKSLELELEAGNKHKQISDRLRDAQSKRRILKAEVDLVNQTRDARIAEINTLQLEFENWQKKLSELVPEQQRLTEKLRSIKQRYSDQPSVHSFSFCTKTALKICFVFTSHRLEKLEQERREQERREQEERERVEEEARQRRLLEEQRARQREEEEREAHARLRAAQEKAQEEERRRREAEEEEEKRKRQEAEEERKRKEEEEEKRRKEEQEREEQLASQLTTYKALYSFVARNADELSIEADCLIEVDEHTVGEPGWLCGRYGGNRGWFPQSYAEKCPTSSTTGTAPSSPGQRSSLPPPLCSNESATTRPISASATHTHTPTHTISITLETTALTDSLFTTSAGPLLARALSSWSPTSENHLTLSPGDAIQVLQQREDWWLGQLNGTQGWFPRSYVPAVKKNRWSPALNPALSAFFFFFFPCSEYVALYTYESPEVGDLTFVEGDVVMVTEREGEWWRGCIGDQTGVFPSNYVRPVEPEAARLGALTKKPEIAQAVSTTAAPTTHQLRLSPGQLIKVLAKNSSGWWLGELQARGKKRQRGWFHSANVKLLGPSCSKSSPSPLPVCQVIAMYNYTAANQDELSFSKGQLITILDKTNPDWWKGEAGGVTGLLPTNYVKMTTDSDPSQQWCADLMTLDSMTPQERKRQGYIHELIQTEENYVEDLELVLEVFYKPMAESGRLTEAEMAVIFVNWRELIMCNTRLLKALRVRKKTGGENMPVQLIGDLLASELAHMQPYSRFCSCQLNAAALLQSKTHSQPDFKDFLKKIATNYRCKGMPLSSFLLKPMQRITRYPLLIKNILEHTPDNHADRVALLEALDRAEELCSQVNEGVREKENSDRLEWIQSHVQCEGPIEHLVFNSLTNCLGPRKLLHSGRLSKTKSSRELWAFLFNDFLLLTHSAKPFLSSGSDKLFSPKTSIQLKMYKTPLFLNEVLVKMPADPSSDEPLFHVSHIDRVYTLKTETLNERTAWVQKIKAASEHFIETEKKKREKAYQARSLKTSGIGRLLVTVTEAQELKACKPNGKSNPYCELTMGAQCYTSRPISDTLNPKWNFNCQFFIKDLYQDVLCITVFEKDQFSPDDFLGRTEVPVATIKNEMESKGAANRRLLLHEVPTGEVSVKLDLQLYEPAK